MICCNFVQFYFRSYKFSKVLRLLLFSFPLMLLFLLGEISRKY